MALSSECMRKCGQKYLEAVEKKYLTTPPLSEMQLGVLRVGLFQDGDVGVGVFQECEEVVVSSAALSLSPCSTLARARPRWASAPMGPFNTTPRWSIIF